MDFDTVKGYIIVGAIVIVGIILILLIVFLGFFFVNILAGLLLNLFILAPMGIIRGFTLYKPVKRGEITEFEDLLNDRISVNIIYRRLKREMKKMGIDPEKDSLEGYPKMKQAWEVIEKYKEKFGGEAENILMFILEAAFSAAGDMADGSSENSGSSSRKSSSGGRSSGGGSSGGGGASRNW